MPHAPNCEKIGQAETSPVPTFRQLGYAADEGSSKAADDGDCKPTGVICILCEQIRAVFRVINQCTDSRIRDPKNPRHARLKEFQNAVFEKYNVGEFSSIKERD